MKFPLNKYQVGLWVLTIADLLVWAIVLYLIAAAMNAVRAEGYSIIYPTQPGMPFVPDYTAPRLQVQQFGSQTWIRETYPGTDVPDYSKGSGYMIQNFTPIPQYNYGSNVPIYRNRIER